MRALPSEPRHSAVKSAGCLFSKSRPVCSRRQQQLSCGTHRQRLSARSADKAANAPVNDNVVVAKKPLGLNKFALRLAVLTVLLVVASVSAPAAHASGETIAAKLRASLPSNAPNWVIVCVMAALPLAELRGAIPVGVSLLGMNPGLVYLLAVLGNMLPVPLLLLGLGPLSDALSSIPIFKKVFAAIFDRARKQGAKWKENEFWALALFVGVPLPGTGAWSGAIAAFVLGMPFGQAMLANFVGVLIAGALMTTLSLLGWKGLWIASAVLLGTPLLAILANAFRKSDDSRRDS